MTRGKPPGIGAHDVDVEVGLRIRARRRELSISQETLAEALGVSFQQIQKYERGGNRVSASRLWEIARVLDVTTSYFFARLNGDFAASEPAADPDASFVFSPEGAELLSAFAILTKVEQRAMLRLIRGLSTRVA